MTQSFPVTVSAFDLTASPALDVGIDDVRLASPRSVFRPAATVEAGMVRLGGQSPMFRPAIADGGKVRLGGQGPIFR